MNKCFDPMLFRNLARIQFSLFGRRFSQMEQSSDNGRKVTAGIIVVGDEILKGHTKDTNSNFLCRRLFELGVTVEKISVIPDSIPIIAREVREFSEKFNHVITSGGVGPTHDDKTFQGVAAAFDEDVAVHPMLESLVRAYFKLDERDPSLPQPEMKLATIPKNAELIWGVHKGTGQRSLYPVSALRNVVVFPGIPRLLERAFEMISERFRNPESRFHARILFLDTDEFAIADILTDVANRFQPSVAIGSYPTLNHSYYRVRVTVDSIVETACDSAFQELSHKLSQWTLAFDTNPVTDAVAKFHRFHSELEKTDPELFAHLTDSINLIQHVFDKYDRKEICLSFNGGKDCTVLLHLVFVILCKKFGEEGFRGLPTIYIQPRNPFIEMEDFIRDASKRYGLERMQLTGSMKPALSQLKEAHPELDVVLMGTRRSDPYSGHLEPLEPTDPDWPPFLRVSPLIGWNYSQIWKLLRGLWLPYCRLYDKGYTSVGCRDNTRPNEALRYVDSFGFTRYQPAFRLQDENMERNGRT